MVWVSEIVTCDEMCDVVFINGSLILYHWPLRLHILRCVAAVALVKCKAVVVVVGLGI